MSAPPNPLMQQQQYPSRDPPSSWNTVSSRLQIDPPSCVAAAAHRHHHGCRALEVAGVGREEEEEAGDAQTGAEATDAGLIRSGRGGGGGGGRRLPAQ